MNATRILLAMCVAIALSASFRPVQAQQRLDVPVLIGKDGPNLDACGSFGGIKGLKPRGDNFLSVRSGPGTSYKELYRLTSSETFAMCDFRNGWYGIVLNSGRDDCGTNSLLPTKRAYKGPCRSGWVHERFVNLLAG